MDDLPQTQTQEDYLEVEDSQEMEMRIPWGRLCAYTPTMLSVELHEHVYTFGRAPSCNIVVEKPQFSSILNVSKEHFNLHRDVNDIVYITDLSKNGTFINGVIIGKNRNHIISNDDVIAIGTPNSRIYTFTSNINGDDLEYPHDMKQRYFISKKIGHGGFGEVRLAHNKRSFQKFAIKKINKSRSNANNAGHVSTPQKIQTEIEILSRFSNVFIIQMIEVFETHRDVFLVLEYMQGGELTTRMVSALPFPENEVKFVFYQVLLGLCYLHKHGVTHRDLKPENVLLFSNNEYPLVKITDFGLSKVMDESSMMETVCGTINYVAPEVLKYSERYNKKVDVWSLGVVLFYMLSKTHPFRGQGREEISRNILAGKITWDVRPWKGISNAAKDLTRRMLTVDPEIRMASNEVCMHDWIEQDVSMKKRVKEQFRCETFDSTETSEEIILSFPVPKRPRLSTID